MNSTEFKVDEPETFGTGIPNYKNDVFLRYTLESLACETGKRMNIASFDWKFISAYGFKSVQDVSIVHPLGFGVLLSLRLSVVDRLRKSLTFSPYIGIIDVNIEKSLMLLLKEKYEGGNPTLIEFPVSFFIAETNDRSDWVLNEEIRPSVITAKLAYCVECCCYENIRNLYYDKDILDTLSSFSLPEDAYRVPLHYKHCGEKAKLEAYVSAKLKDIRVKGNAEAEKYKEFLNQVLKISLSDLLHGRIS